MARGSWKPGDVSQAKGFEHPVPQGLHPHTLWEITWLEPRTKPKAKQHTGAKEGAGISDSHLCARRLRSSPHLGQP